MAARRLQAGLTMHGFHVRQADLTLPLRQGPLCQGALTEEPNVAPGPGTLLVHVNGPMLPWALVALGGRAVAGKRVIAVWNWELPVLPTDWNRGFKCCHEIWAASRFTAEALSGSVPVRHVPYPVLPASPAAMGRDAFGLPHDAFVALQVFDAASSIARKNPAASIAAHHKAFGDDPSQILLLKVHNTARAGAAWGEVASLAAMYRNVRILDASMSEAELSALILACDVLLSLHRAEGFGFTLAEALALGRPVVATGWSGNVDFMDASGAHAVPYRLLPATDMQKIYDLPGAFWADPDLTVAAVLLRRVFENPEFRRPPPKAFPPPNYHSLLNTLES